MPGFTVGMVHHGIGRITLDGGGAVDAPAGSALVFPSGGGYRVEHHGCTGRGICASTLSFTSPAAALWEEIARGLCLRRPVAAIPLRASPAAELLLGALGLAGHRLEWRDLASTLAGGIVEATVSGSARSRETPRRTRRASLATRASDLLATRLTEPLHLDQLAASLHCSPHHLCRSFRRETGSTLSSELRRLRIAAAVRRLLAGERNLGRMASDLGFASHSHFSTDFRRVTGSTPSEFRDRRADDRRPVSWPPPNALLPGKPGSGQSWPLPL